MDIVLLLTSTLLLAYYAKPGDNRSYRIALLAVFGIAYFCIWRFVRFYLDIFHGDMLVNRITFTSLMLSVVVLMLLPWFRNISRNLAWALTVLFVFCVILSFALDKPIKNRLAGWGGYYDDLLVNFPHTVKPLNGLRFDYQAGGISIDLPHHWQQKTHASGQSYFEWQQGSVIVAEVRPSCFHNTDLAVAEIVSNIVNWDESQSLVSKKLCRVNNDRYECFIHVTANKAVSSAEKWRWLVMDKDQRQNIELNFIFYTDAPQSREEAQSIIQSLRIRGLSDPLPLCVSTIDWF